MTKLSKFLRQPGLYFKDAIKKRIKKRSPLKNEIKVKPQIIVPLNKFYFKINIRKMKINFIIIDNVNEPPEVKEKILKHQFRSINKYIKFNRLAYISEEIYSSSGNCQVYKNYQNFYEEEVLTKLNKNEIYIFIGLNFFFLRPVKIEDFVDKNGRMITYNKKNKYNIYHLDDNIKNYVEDASCNFHPVENFCITNTMNLVYFKHLEIKEVSLAHYLFKTLPVLEVLVSHNILQETPIQFARLDHGYIEKFLWIQTVHGSKRCPLAITFDQKIADPILFEEFLNNLYPHVSRLEKDLVVWGR